MYYIFHLVPKSNQFFLLCKLLLISAYNVIPWHFEKDSTRNECVWSFGGFFFFKVS